MTVIFIKAYSVLSTVSTSTRNSVSDKVSVGVPAISPVLVFNVKPAGRVGRTRKNDPVNFSTGINFELVVFSVSTILETL